MNLMIVFLIAIAYCYPIAITNTDLQQQDLFINQNDLITRLRQQQMKKITIVNIQTSYSDNEQFQSKLLQKLQSLRAVKKILQLNGTFVSTYIDYQPMYFFQQLRSDKTLQVQTIHMNFQNLKGLDKYTKQSDSILIIMFSRISSNVKLLEEIQETAEDIEQEAEDVIAVQIAEDGVPTENTIYTVTSNQLAGYLVFFMTIFALWIAVQCNAVIQTPERFSKQNYFIGKES